jgi:hypothetical protein
MTFYDDFFADMANFVNTAIISFEFDPIHAYRVHLYLLVDDTKCPYHDLGEPDDLFADTYRRGRAVKERKSNCNVNEKELITIVAEYKRSKHTCSD